MKKLSAPKFNTKTLTRFFGNHYDKFIIGLVVALIGFGFYLLYTLTYDSIINPTPISQNELVIQQKKLDIQRYEKTLDTLQRKSDYSGPQTPPAIF